MYNFYIIMSTANSQIELKLNLCRILASQSEALNNTLIPKGLEKANQSNGNGKQFKRGSVNENAGYGLLLCDI